MAHFVNKDKDFRNYFRSSKFFLGSPNEPLAIPDAVNWEILPSELKPIHQKRKSRIKVKPNLVKKQKNVDWKNTKPKKVLVKMEVKVIKTRLAMIQKRRKNAR